MKVIYSNEVIAAGEIDLHVDAAFFMYVLDSFSVSLGKYLDVRIFFF